MAKDKPFQIFTVQTRPEDGPPRLAALRAKLAEQGFDGFIVPRTDAHQGEYVTAQDARLGWLTGFSGSAGYAIVTQKQAGVFVDGRYRVQVKGEVDLAHYTPVNWPEVSLADWLRQALPQGGRVAYDPWLQSRKEIRDITAALANSNIALIPTENFVDAIWADRPAPQPGPVRLHSEAIAGRTAAEKRAALAAVLKAQNQASTVLTLADSIAWLLNIRGEDLPKNPVVQGFAVIDDDGRVELFSEPSKFGPDVRAKLGNDVVILPLAGLPAALGQLNGPVRLDPASAPDEVFRLVEARADVIEGPDPVILPKAIKTPSEIEGMRQAHLRDAVAMIEMLAWIDAQPTDGSLTEIDVVEKLESLRKTQGAHDVSFDTISSTGPNAAINHYHVNEQTNLPIRDGELLLLDSGGQYADGTTDITRTIPIGTPSQKHRLPYTLVLQGMVNLSRLRFPKGRAGRDIDAVARAPLWTAGLDFDHGTGHGVGAALCVHEGPVRIARISEIALQAGMILSNEPGYYREGDFGIRLENLIVVERAESPDGREMLGFETLTWVPIDTRLIDTSIMAPAEIDWLNAYHSEVLAKIGPQITGPTHDWLVKATQPITR
ncbi:aminopeptidase P family protein [Paracoccus sp. (in: a-proteobacteria)]|uniref:aminopeptidase P family protein n=1 Tax=Paracoccus sp. TaxID=267 RepID=UPI00289C4306|nr:aminopeptidase P family protein [Paracoccus sp. (in: a-proteobacteria)]